MKKKILSLILCAALLNGTQEMAWASAETYSEGENSYDWCGNV